MPKFFIVNADKDGVAVEHITHYEVYGAVEPGPDDPSWRRIARPLTVKLYGTGGDLLATAVNMYAVDFLRYAAAHEADSIA